MEDIIFNRDFESYEVWNGDLCLQMRIYEPRNIVFEVSLVGFSEVIWLDHIFADQHPELLDLFDFESKTWNESELADFWDGLTVCLA